MIRAVLFDMGGTLHTSSNSKERELKFAGRVIERLGDYGIHLDTTPEALAPLLHKNAEEYKHATEQSLCEMPCDVVWSEYYLKDFGIPRETIAPYAEELSFLYDYDRTKIVRRPNLISTMDELEAMGMRLGVISNIISRSVMPHFLAEYGLLERMECIVLSSVTGIRKPSADIFRIAEKELGLKPEELVYVGDTISRDVRGVRNAGWKCVIQIDNPSVAHRDACMQGLGYEADYHISDLSEIPAIVKKLNA